MSIAIDTSDDIKRPGFVDATTVDTVHRTAPTVPSGADRPETIPIGTEQLRAMSGDFSVATTARQSDGPSPSISIQINDASLAGAPSESSDAATFDSTASLSRVAKRPLVIVGGAALVLAIVFGAAFLLTHKKPAAALPAPPATLFASPPPSPPPTPAAAPAAPAPAPTINVGAAAAPGPEPSSEPKPVEAKHRHLRKRAKQQDLDPHGLPIVD
jgi:hypothetical protein